MIKSNGKNHIKSTFILVSACCFLSVVFKLFEPIFVYKTAWNPLIFSDSPPLETEYFGAQWAARAELATKLITSSYSEINAPAISIAISVDGETAWRAAMGYADLESSLPVSHQHAFRIGSTSKPITAMAVGVLVDQGKLKLDDSMREIDPSLSEVLNEVTLEHVLSHRSGIRNYGTCLCFPIWEHLNNKHFDSVRASAAVVENSSLLTSPGESYRYTSLGFNLAGLAVTQAADESFSNAVTALVLKPLNMDHTYIENRRDRSVMFAKPYEIENGSYKATFPVDQSIRWPSGGFLSTPSDLLKLGNAMLDNRLLSKKVRDKLLAIPEQGASNGGEVYALGWRLSDWRLNERQVVTAFHHNGVSVGGISVFAVFPNENIVVSAMINKNGTNVGELAGLVNRLILIFLKDS